MDIDQAPPTIVLRRGIDVAIERIEHLRHGHWRVGPSVTGTPVPAHRCHRAVERPEQMSDFMSVQAVSWRWRPSTGAYPEISV
jgi:hypothetical protein